MEADVLAYVTPEKLTDWKRLTLTRRPRPEYVYGSNDPEKFKDSVGAGTRLWVFSCAKGWCPVLVARLIVTGSGPRTSPELKLTKGLRRHYRAFTWLALGDPQTSEFFGHNDAGRALARTVVVRKHGLTRLGGLEAKWCASDYQKLRRPAAVAEEFRRQGLLLSPGAKPLEELGGLAKRAVFISWKWSDNAGRRGFILEFARALAELDVMVWLDLLAFPMSPALEVLREDHDRLEKLLKYGYQRCSAVVAIGTRHFGTLNTEIPKNRNWTAREWKGTIVRGKRVDRVVYPFDTELPAMLDDADHCLASRSPGRAAQELREYLDDHRRDQPGCDRPRGASARPGPPL